MSSPQPPPPSSKKQELPEVIENMKLTVSFINICIQLIICMIIELTSDNMLCLSFHILTQVCWVIQML